MVKEEYVSTWYSVAADLTEAKDPPFSRNLLSRRQAEVTAPEALSYTPGPPQKDKLCDLTTKSTQPCSSVETLVKRAPAPCGWHAERPWWHSESYRISCTARANVGSAMGRFRGLRVCLAPLTCVGKHGMVATILFLTTSHIIYF